MVHGRGHRQAAGVRVHRVIRGAHAQDRRLAAVRHRGRNPDATVASVRKVKWDSFQPNFFLIFAPGLLDGTQGTYMTAVHMEARNPKTITELVRQFPSVSVFNVDDLLRPGALHHRKGAGRRAERVPVHADGGPGGADRRRAGQPGGTPLRKRHAAYAGRAARHRAQRPAVGVRHARACCPEHWRPPGRRWPACTSRARCCKFPTRSIRGSGSTDWWAEAC